MLADEEPKYLRRQKPVEIKRRKFGRKAWKTYIVVTFWAVVALLGATALYAASHFLLTAREMALIHPDQVLLSGNHYVTRASVLEIFAADRSRSVLRIPIDRRRQELEAIPWVEQATVRRALPNKIQVELIERTPIAFLRDGADMALVDAHGVILDRPLTANFHFPVVTGISAAMQLDDREQRMQLFAGFMKQIESARPGASDQVSEVDLSDAHDVSATVSGLQKAGTTGNESWGQADAPVIVHFGDGDFAGKFQTLADNIGQWRATAGRVESVDLRFSREAVVNPDPTLVSQNVAAPAPAPRPQKTAARAKHSRYSR